MTWENVIQTGPMKWSALFYILAQGLTSRRVRRPILTSQRNVPVLYYIFIDMDSIYLSWKNQPWRVREFSVSMYGVRRLFACDGDQINYLRLYNILRNFTLQNKPPAGLRYLLNIYYCLACVPNSRSTEPRRHLGKFYVIYFSPR